MLGDKPFYAHFVLIYISELFLLSFYLITYVYYITIVLECKDDYSFM